MPDWIDERDERLKKIEADTRQREERQAREARLIETFGPDLVTQLENMVRRDVDKWNKRFDDTIAVDKHPGGPGGFTVTRSKFPRGFASIAINSTTRRVEYCLERSRPMNSGEMYKHEDFLPLAVSANNDVYISSRHRSEHVTMEQVSQMIIESVADPHSHHLI